MKLEEKFMEVLWMKISKQDADILSLREILVEFRDKGMNKENMLKSLEKLRKKTSQDREDIVLELMDFVVGFCDTRMIIFGENSY